MTAWVDALSSLFSVARIMVYDFEVAKNSLTLEMDEISEISKIVSDKSPKFLFEFEQF
jgi:hypothetical protein